MHCGTTITELESVVGKVDGLEVPDSDPAHPHTIEHILTCNSSEWCRDLRAQHEWYRARRQMKFVTPELEAEIDRWRVERGANL